MISVSEFCPGCQSLQGMEVTVSLREEVDPEGNLRKLVTKSYHYPVSSSLAQTHFHQPYRGHGVQIGRLP
jgi:hypothetical protein